MKKRFAFTLAAFLLLAAKPVLAQEGIEGIWVLDRLVQNANPNMTDAALTIQSNYDLLSDDPSLECIPASLGRVYANPNSRLEISYNGSNLQINYELFDLRRYIEFSDAIFDSEEPSTRNLTGQYFFEMGVSRAEWSADELLVHTTHYQPGFIRTSSGIPQGANTTTTERFYRDGPYLMLDLTYSDPELFEQPFTIVHRLAADEAEQLPVYNCQDASYDWFEQLNNPAELPN